MRCVCTGLGHGVEFRQQLEMSVNQDLSVETSGDQDLSVTVCQEEMHLSPDEMETEGALIGPKESPSVSVSVYTSRLHAY